MVSPNPTDCCLSQGACSSAVRLDAEVEGGSSLTLEGVAGGPWSGLLSYVGEGGVSCLFNLTISCSDGVYSAFAENFSTSCMPAETINCDLVVDSYVPLSIQVALRSTCEICDGLHIHVSE